MGDFSLRSQRTRGVHKGDRGGLWDRPSVHLNKFFHVS